VGTRLRELYDRLWSEAIGAIRAGGVETDPVLAAGMPDRRRGLTLIARPSPLVRRRVAAFLDGLREIEPEQHYYALSELHVTVLSLFTATVDHAPLLARTARYVSAVDAAMRDAASIRIEFAGVTATPGAILVQGFFENHALDDLRDSLRRQLRASGLAGGVDRRYRLETAHITVARFRARLRDGERLAARIERARHRPFGATTVRSVSLVETDWYMTRQTARTVKRYRLPGQAALGRCSQEARTPAARMPRTVSRR
jgi:2'-5' RNA ligase